MSPIRHQLQPQLQVHDAPLSLADLTRIARDGGERISDADSQVSNSRLTQSRTRSRNSAGQVLVNFGHLEMPCSKWMNFICRFMHLHVIISIVVDAIVSTAKTVYVIRPSLPATTSTSSGMLRS